jgi:acyl-CoA thioester hydrolase
VSALFQCKVYLDDTDAQGVVYNANYLIWLERARSEWLEQKGLSHLKLREDFNCVLVLHATKINFRKSAMLGDELIVHTELKEHNFLKFNFYQKIINKNAETILCEATSCVVAIDQEKHKPKKIEINL